MVRVDFLKTQFEQQEHQSVHRSINPRHGRTAERQVSVLDPVTAIASQWKGVQQTTLQRGMGSCPGQFCHCPQIA